MKLKKWEIALIIALVFTVLCSVGVARDQRRLSDKLIRLHVVANSDSEADQALKLAVRDRVTAFFAPLLTGITERSDAEMVIRENLDTVTEVARGEIFAQGYGYAVTAKITVEEFPTREYDTFSLPAGKYEALRIEIGDAAGRNWWCVVFPPLCAAPAMDALPVSALTPDEVALITEDSAEYVVRFKAIEFLSKLRVWLKF